MLVKAVISFVSDVSGQKYRIPQGWEGPMPEGADWLDVGFVVPVKDQKIETATKKPAETRAKKTTKKSAGEKIKGAVNKVMSTRSLKK